jgi:biopolymer transport protein ExbB/TolQ
VSTNGLYQSIYTIAGALEIPVVILTLLALADVLYESGAFLVEYYHRRRRRFPALSAAAKAARSSLDAGDGAAACRELEPVAWSNAMMRSYGEIVAATGQPDADIRINKYLADFDFNCQRRLGRTRLLVRAGPALGLMGTLIPLAPALEGLANGDVQILTENLRRAFSITVLGLFIGAVAFALSLIRDHMYGQDYSDLEYVAAVLTADLPATQPNDNAIPTPTKVEVAVVQDQEGVRK